MSQRLLPTPAAERCRPIAVHRMGERSLPKPDAQRDKLDLPKHEPPSFREHIPDAVR